LKTAVLSLITPAMTNVPSTVKHLSIIIEDSPNTDILSHLDQCVEWIDSVLREERDQNVPTVPEGPELGVLEGEKQVVQQQQGSPANKVVRKGGVLVHCQAGMSRSATITAAYLMKMLDIGVEEALDMIRVVRPVIE
jgi:dual specificity phosphatase 12